MGAIIFVLMIVIFAAFWKMFKKAGQPGWASIVPIYNTYVMLQIAGRPGWWLLLYFIPVANFVVSIVIALDIAKAFGKSALFGVVSLILFPYIGYPMLGFGKAQYLGTGTPQGPANPTPPTAVPPTTPPAAPPTAPTPPAAPTA